MRRRRRFAPLISLLMVVALAACGGGASPFEVAPAMLPQPPAQAEAAYTAYLFRALAEHETRWRSLGIAHYRLTVYHTNFRNDNQTETITVQGGRVTGRVVACGHPGVTEPATTCTKQQNEPDAFTVPDIFKLARELAPDPTHYMRVTFEPFTGLPRTLSLHSGEERRGELVPRRTTLYVLHIDDLEVLP